MAIWVYTKQIKDRDAASEISDTLQSMDEEMAVILNETSSIPREDLFGSFSNVEDREYDLFAFDQERLIAWSDHSVGNIQKLSQVIAEQQCLLLNNGYYLVRYEKSNGLDLYAVALIKNQFAYENNYLQNSFAPAFNLRTNPEITLQAEENSQTIHLGDKSLFYITDSKTKHDNHFWEYASLILFVLAFLFLVQGLIRKTRIKDYSLLYIPLFVLVLIGLRFLLYKLQFIFQFDELALFNPEIYASSNLFPSLGDFFITAMIVFVGAQVIWKWVCLKAEYLSAREHLYGLFINLSLYFSFGFVVNRLFRGLVEDSNISFNINNFFNLSPFSILAIIVVGFLLFGIYYLGLSVNEFFTKTETRIKNYQVFGLIFVLYIIFSWWQGTVDWIMILWPGIFLLVVILLEKNKENRLSVRILLLVILTLYGSYMFEKYSEIKTKKKLVILSDKISINNDIVAENLYLDIEKNMRNDTELFSAIQKIAKGSNNQSSKLIDKYFKGYWNRYEINTYLFDSLGTSIYSSSNLLGKTKRELDRSIMDASYSTPEGLHMVNPEDRHLSYMVYVPVEDTSIEERYDYYLEFEYKFVTEELGFPELLIKGNTFTKDFSDYSVARYLDEKLISQKGSFPFLIDRNAETHGVRDSLYTKSGYLHYAVEKEPYTFVISKAKDSWLNKITDFTYLYSIFGLMFVVFILLEKAEDFSTATVFSLQVKIQTLVISIVLISLLFFGFGAYYYIVSQNKAKNENLLREKVSSVLIELSHKLEKENAIDDDEKIAKYLTKFSNVFFTDINIYALDGHLRATSRPQLFDNGIISTRMHPEAFYSLAYQKNSRFTQNETIGKLNYLSSYVPFYGKDFEVLAYLNLPYFAKQAELEQELSAFVVAIINMLVILFILSAFGALFVSRLITSPLKTIQDNLSEISLDSTNRPISYTGKDEIGTLVNAYNDKLDELREKAEELAKSEREMAWREMAKQVAHEIKNPLTPMKLSIQYLQRAWKDKSEDWEDRFNRSTVTLIEQIDTLSSIATAFSDFAKMPAAQSQEIDLRSILEQVIALFSENVADAVLTFENELAGPQYIYADKDQITRVFNNLIKNAIQSIPENEEGQITIALSLKGHQYIVVVKDNGIGISDDKKDKIFVPNFTTKSTGTGLGLAMVQSIVENTGGKVWFTTKLGLGSSFFVSLDKAN